MKKLLILFLFTAFPGLALAADGGGALTFAPPASDFSVVFLGNLFGTVDGVLHGTGSQIMGAMFGVFNAAVLAIGGIIIMYTLLVSTMNTAHEGQVLGQKWSSIWVPVRSTIGLALLIPKASGYCLMQIFVMWIVVQGVGAADRVWNAALDYLNRGGVIIQAEVSNPLSPHQDVRVSEISEGAATILASQVCMVGVQRALEIQRQSYLSAKQNNSGPCVEPAEGSPMQSFCQTAVPDFLGTVNVIAAQRNNEFQVDMPNFETGSPYHFLNGLCGTIKWEAFGESTIASMQKIAGTGQLDTIKLSRAIGIQQMYSDLSLVARVMVNNNPRFAQRGDQEHPFSDVANEQFGVPYTQAGNICPQSSDTNPCITWGTAAGTTGAVLFNGTEFVGAISDYNGILKPALNLINQAKDEATAIAARNFISEAETRGWLLAGSYFFDLVKLNGSAVAKTEVDQGSGMGGSDYKGGDNLLSSFGPNNTCVANSTFEDLCLWFGGAPAMMNNLKYLIQGDGSVPNQTGGQSNTTIRAFTNTPIKTFSDTQSSTAFGFIQNSLAMSTPGQPGIAPDFHFADMIHIKIDSSKYRLDEQTFDCGEVKIVFFKFCLGRMFGNLFYNAIFRHIFNFFMDIFQQLIEEVVQAFLMIPLQGMAFIFRDGLKILSTPGVNPIVALAQMGTTYINFAGNLWIMLLTMSVSSAIMPIFGIFIFALIAMAMPLLIAWIGVMVAVGFTTAYYVPLLPYFIFTFGVIAWLMAVIEAMVAGPIVALGVTHPEGHEAFGKGEHAIMILLNVFLRPSMMIIGYIAGIALSYVGVWVLNTGYEHAVSFMQPPPGKQPTGIDQYVSVVGTEAQKTPGGVAVDGGYTSWAGIYAFFFSILAYTGAYLTIVQKSFTLITSLPDRVLRWIGSNPESIGGEAAQWGEETKGKIDKAGEGTYAAQQQIDNTLKGYGQKAIKGGVDAGKKGMNKLKSGEGSVEASPSAPPE